MTVDINDSLFQLPAVIADTMYQKVKAIDSLALTSGAAGGNGVFDQIMSSLKAHLNEQYENGRITGSEYSKAYIAMTEAALQTATQFLLSRDQAFWAAQNAQIAGITARIQQETVRYEYLKAKYEYDTTIPLQTQGLTLANSISNFNLAEMLPVQLLGAQLQNTETQIRSDGLTTQNLIATYTYSTTLPLQSSLLTAQVAGEGYKNTGIQKQNIVLDYQVNYMLPAQLDLVKEQTEVQHAQTWDYRKDVPSSQIAGLIGQQKSLYGQQITSYKRDAEVKAAKLFSDAWITQKTIDEGLTAPTGFTNASLDTVLTALKVNNNLT